MESSPATNLLTDTPSHTHWCLLCKEDGALEVSLHYLFILFLLISYYRFIVFLSSSLYLLLETSPQHHGHFVIVGVSCCQGNSSGRYYVYIVSLVLVVVHVMLSRCYVWGWV